MAKIFHEWNVEQTMLFPPSVRDFVPAGHLAHFVRDTVAEALDLEAIRERYDEERGYPPYHPVMMVALLLYAYCQGIYSSRRIARACEERVDFMAVTALNGPNFRTIADFRKEHLAALQALFVQVLRLCQRAGLVRLGHVALDGTKLKANASRHKAMSYRGMGKREGELAAEGRALVCARRGARSGRRCALGRAGSRGCAARLGRTGAEGTPLPRVQRNFTDPDSRIMKYQGGSTPGSRARTEGRAS